MVKEDNGNKESQIIEHGDIFSSIDLKLELKRLRILGCSKVLHGHFA
jgi:hypothetical protein